MLEDAGARLDLLERAEGAQAAVVDDDQLAGLDLAKEARADDVERDRLGREDRGLAELAHHQRPDPERVAAGDQSLLGEDQQRIGAFDLA